MSVEFLNRRIVITGGAGVIGIATARAFLDHAAHVLLVDSDAERLTAAHEALGRTRVFTSVSDLGNPAICANVMRNAAPIYALVHLAGLFERDPFVPDEHDVWDRAIAANLTTAYDVAVAFVRYADPKGPTRVVLTSSMADRRMNAASPPYAAAEAGIVGLTRAFSQRLAPNVLVNSIVHGFIEHSMPDSQLAERGEDCEKEVPLQRYGEVASVIRFLCSRDASCVTGQTIMVDGGLADT